MKLYTATQMREIDRSAIEEMGIPSLALMENAASALHRALWAAVPELLEGRVAVVCGKGNNGGDGMALARLLAGSGCAARVFLVGEMAALSPDAQIQFRKLKSAGLTCSVIGSDESFAALEEALSTSDLVVDALLGTGLGGPARGIAARAIEAVNASGAFVVAVDIPSGFSGDAFAPIGPAVRASLTLTLALPKPVLFTPEGAPFCGEVRVLDIGIPPEAVATQESLIEALDESWAAPHFAARPQEAHKGSLGRVVLIAGCAGKSGAAVLAARGALRAGAGLVTVICPRSVQPQIAASLPEAMTLPLAETSAGTLAHEALQPILDCLKAADGGGIGPGMGLAGETAALAREIYRRAKRPMAVDADALNAFAGREAELSVHEGPRLLTPHPGEMGRLIGMGADGVLAKRYQLVPDHAKSWNAVLLLKGFRTLIASPRGPWRLNLSGGPFMAGPGFGDVLTGLAAALLARGIDPFEAGSLAAWWHGAAAEVASVRLGGYGLLASECADALPLVEGRLRQP